MFARECVLAGDCNNLLLKPTRRCATSSCLCLAIKDQSEEVKSEEENSSEKPITAGITNKERHSG